MLFCNLSVLTTCLMYFQENMSHQILLPLNKLILMRYWRKKITVISCSDKQIWLIKRMLTWAACYKTSSCNAHKALSENGQYMFILQYSLSPHQQEWGNHNRLIVINCNNHWFSIIHSNLLLKRFFTSCNQDLINSS